MLTPKEVTGCQFSKSMFKGYDMRMVDDFLETLSNDYTTLYKENAVLKAKMRVLIDRIEKQNAVIESFEER